MIEKIVLHNFKRFKDETIPFNESINILVGDNNTGKSTILEAIHLVLTKRLNGKLIENELSHYLFNKDIADDYIASLSTESPQEPPMIWIELWLKESADYISLRGNNNQEKVDAIGIKLIISFNEINSDDYFNLLKNGGIRSIPTDWYKIEWYGFDGNSFFPKIIPNASFIDTSRIMLTAGSDLYLKEIIDKSIEPTDRIALSMAYLGLRHDFADNPILKQIDDHLLENPSEITNSKLAVALDLTHKSSWDKTLTVHVDGQPFEYSGRGEQSTIKAMLALRNKTKNSGIVLFEEPENNLSYSSMRSLMCRVEQKLDGKQLFISTHSSYVLNKLGLNNLHLFSSAGVRSLRELQVDTYKYFKILPGYDTLRVLLAKRVILVEGPSDELIIQRAYFDKNGVLPIDNGIDVLSVRGLSFKRFLDLARVLGKIASVVTDNDGDIANNITKKYKRYSTEFKVYTSSDELLHTLEPNIVSVNNLDILNLILNKSFADKVSVQQYMEGHKTAWAIAVFESDQNITFPDYILNAIQ